ncbi:hypothetical protein [Niastella koreensis]|nr:hypothetical protein [Niastella koreensis]
MSKDQVELSGMYANIVVANFKERIRYFFRKIADFPALIVNNWANVA